MWKVTTLSVMQGSAQDELLHAKESATLKVTVT